MEVVEHVANVPLYMKSCADLVAPGRAAVLGHHQPHGAGAGLRQVRRRVRAALAAPRHARLEQVPDAGRARRPDHAQRAEDRSTRRGVVFHPLADEWRKSTDMGINYMVLAERPA